MDIEELKKRQKEKYLQAGAIVPIDMRTTGDLVHELHQSADAIESLQRELEETRRDAERYRCLRHRFDACAAELQYSPVDDGSPFLQVAQGLDQGAALDAAIDTLRQQSEN